MTSSSSITEGQKHREDHEDEGAANDAPQRKEPIGAGGGDSHSTRVEGEEGVPNNEGSPNEAAMIKHPMTSDAAAKGDSQHCSSPSPRRNSPNLPTTCLPRCLFLLAVAAVGGIVVGLMFAVAKSSTQLLLYLRFLGMFLIVVLYLLYFYRRMVRNKYVIVFECIIMYQ